MLTEWGAPVIDALVGFEDGLVARVILVDDNGAELIGLEDKEEDESGGKAEVVLFDTMAEETIGGDAEADIPAPG